MDGLPSHADVAPLEQDQGHSQQHQSRAPEHGDIAGAQPAANGVVPPVYRNSDKTR